MLDAAVLKAPMTELMGVTVAQAQPGRVILHSVPKAAFSNQLGILHGGYVATLLDCACGAAVYSVIDADQYCLTIDIRINYLEPVPISDAPLEILGTLRKAGRRIAFAEAILRTTAGQELATASASLAIKRVAGAGS